MSKQQKNKGQQKQSYGQFPEQQAEQDVDVLGQKPEEKDPQQQDKDAQDQVKKPEEKDPQQQDKDAQDQVKKPEAQQGKDQQTQSPEAPVEKKEEGKKEEGKKSKPLDDKKDRLMRSLNTFAVVMHPDNNTEGAKAGKAHFTLARRLRDILNEESSKDAKALWKEFLQFTRDNKETFSMSNVFRYIQYWDSDRKEYDFYRSVMFIAIRYNPGNLKDNLKNVSVEDLLKHLNKKQASNFTSIYNLE